MPPRFYKHILNVVNRKPLHYDLILICSGGNWAHADNHWRVWLKSESTTRTVSYVYTKESNWNPNSSYRNLPGRSMTALPTDLSPRSIFFLATCLSLRLHFCKENLNAKILLSSFLPSFLFLICLSVELLYLKLYTFRRVSVFCSPLVFF